MTSFSGTLAISQTEMKENEATAVLIMFLINCYFGTSNSILYFVIHSVKTATHLIICTVLLHVLVSQCESLLLHFPHSVSFKVLSTKTLHDP